MAGQTDTPKCRRSPKILRQRRVTRVSPIGRDKNQSEALSKHGGKSVVRKTADLSPEEILERNAKERERVHAVNDQYQKLKDMIPYRSKGRRMSKETIVKLTTQYIKDLIALIQEYDNGTLDPDICTIKTFGYGSRTSVRRHSAQAEASRTPNQPQPASLWSQPRCGQASLSPEFHSGMISLSAERHSSVASFSTESHSTAASFSNKYHSGGNSFSPQGHSGVASFSSEPYLGATDTMCSTRAFNPCPNPNATSSWPCTRSAPEHLVTTIRYEVEQVNNTSPNNSFGSTGSCSYGSDSPMNLDHAGYRLNLLCQQSPTSPQANNNETNDAEHQNKASCSYSQYKMLVYNQTGQYTGYMGSHAVTNQQNGSSWLSSAPELDLLCL